MYHKAGLIVASAFVALVACLPNPVPQQSEGGFTITSSFTQYGGCLRDTVACGSFDNGFNAAVSENLYGQDNGKSAGTCGTCWSLTPTHDMNGKPLSGAQSVVVKVNDLCPFKGNEKYCQPVGSREKNEMQMDAHFDLCADAGAAGAMFGESGTTLATGTATRVDCSERGGGSKLLI